MNDYGPAVRRILAENGWRLHRHGKGDHQVWRHEESRRQVTVDSRIKSRHSANETLKQAGLPKAF